MSSLNEVRTLCVRLPDVTEKLSHGEPCWFVHGKTFAMSANNHHGDGRIAIWIPAAPGEQELLIRTAPEKFFRPPYVGVRGWVGVELGQVSAEELSHAIRAAWRLIAPKRLRAAFDRGETHP